MDEKLFSEQIILEYLYWGKYFPGQIITCKYDNALIPDYSKTIFDLYYFSKELDSFIITDDTDYINQLIYTRIFSEYFQDHYDKPFTQNLFLIFLSIPKTKICRYSITKCTKLSYKLKESLILDLLHKKISPGDEVTQIINTDLELAKDTGLEEAYGLIVLRDGKLYLQDNEKELKKSIEFNLLHKVNFWNCDLARFYQYRLKCKFFCEV